MNWITSQRVYAGIVVLSSLLLISGWRQGFASNSHFIEAKHVSIAAVQSGEFSQKVTGYGSLLSQNQRLITASSVAIVDEIKLRPGAIVEADSVLLTLKNPELDNALQQAEATLQNSRTTKRKFMLEQQRELLEQASRLAELKADAEMANLQVEAEAPLANEGIISAMDMRRSRLKADQLNERLTLEHEKLSKLRDVHREHLSIQDEAIKQAEAEFHAAQYQHDQLIVRAGIKGVLQRQPISLGQSVNVGDELALVGSLSPLLAEIKVPQMQIQLVQHGAMADIDTRHGIVSGQVIRIDPVVADGAVSVDIKLPEALSADIRPMQMVDAVIYGKSRGQVNFVSKPQGVAEDSRLTVFKLDNPHQASRVQVQFGKIAGNSIEVISGLQAGEKIIVSALAIDADVTQIQLTQ
ncbi:HlyD family efflux transporter periplasmic adaptor subunit [Shewanella sp. CG12_big_fil_rev_8_21_14_0_65_47_15]|uniref:efflux RND transporter periplasmic adaptor subunit n=1 Tax=Shewanella sp. CG12_big_fil_rev_8_21_14_0_65_47_15 TaxID=1975537 RepID=UPI000CB91184|nr:HlyD family efflux transporter periplasmic adaptor subunit [Shewanella sp. CG12_big_fil_rev_8_21_14_0_65_47_15]PIW60068.1 MAG: RND transporter [Shewanella sp. CG12_big_fil_rev_8_21_14_0_65_47_15]